MKIPTIKQFNNWSFKEKLKWIDSESYGKYKIYTRAQGYFHFIIYEKEEVAIVYSVDPKGNLAEAVAMRIPEALDRLQRFKNASDVVVAASKVS